MEMVSVSGGVVSLHDARRKRRWAVELQPFEIGKFPVTAHQLGALSGGKPGAGPQHPAVSVSWIDAIELCNAASKSYGLAPSYVVHGTDVRWTVCAEGFRLPTEAEWEFACRAGSSTPHYGPLPEAAWTSHDRVSSPQPVGLKLPNELGLFDTLGNVWEWCWNLLDPARYNDYRVFRGGGFADPSWSVRASARRGGAPGTRLDDVGFRVARGGFRCVDEAQGWSAAEDHERAAGQGLLPFGWTPLR
ncbi:formylglycine-generating enzyme family protein [Arthrobacter sp. CG_A4]|uniref:formylglycine-generating enzyme family protein n=1 Tax=Arthrobacter sp. CG_A4 TaxID=3071706 RepID=UPI003FA34EB0